MSHQINQYNYAECRSQILDVAEHINQSSLEIHPLSEFEIKFLMINLEFGVEPELSKTFNEVDGFLNALAVGPVGVAPNEWLPILVAPELVTSPITFEDMEIDNIQELLVRRFNIIAAGLKCKPLVNHVYWSYVISEYDKKNFRDVTEWARGFCKGVKWRWKDWLPLTNGCQPYDFLGPIALLGLEEYSKELEQLTHTFTMRSALTKQIHGHYFSLYHYWHEKTAV